MKIYRLRVTAVMEVDLEYTDEAFVLPEHINPDDQDAVDDYLYHYAKDLDGGLFTQENGGGDWRICDKELCEITA